MPPKRHIHKVEPFLPTLPPGVADITLRRLYPAPDPHGDDPAGWMHDKLGRCLWSKQVEILEAIRDHRMVGVQSCHGPGKSFTASGAGTWWMDVHELGSAFLVTTAPSWPQVEAILWKEIKRRFNEGRLHGRITLDCQWHMGAPGTKRADATEELIAMGRKPQDYDEDTFQGIHARYFMAILDEACGIPEALWNSVLSLATNENSRILAIGNPDDPNSRFARICKPGSGWHIIKISVWDTPNFTGESDCAVCGKPLSDEILESLTSHVWVEDRRRDWGEGSPIWTAKVDGEFPDISDEYLISPALLEKSYRTELSGFALGRYGIDIARMGVDKSVIYRNRDGVVRLVDSWGQTDTMSSAGRIKNHLTSHGKHFMPANIDIIGVGAGVFDRLREQRLNVAPYQGSQRALNPAKFKNRRAESWWTFRELMDDGLIDLDPADEKLAAELGSVRWGVDSAGRIFIESKEDMRERGLPSPDHGDAAVLSTVEAGAVPARDYDTSPTLTGDLLEKVM
jgi:hypothetical protein